MENILSNAIIVAVALTPILSALVEAVKKANLIQERYLPFVAILVGFLLSVAISLAFGLDVAEGAVVGLVAGLASSGLYDGIKGVSK